MTINPALTVLDTFGEWLDRTNLIANVVNQVVPSANTISANSVTSPILSITGTGTLSGANTNVTGGTLLITSNTNVNAILRVNGVTVLTGVTANTQLTNSVVTAHALASGAVSANTKLAASVVTAHAIAANSVSGGKLTDGAVSANTKLAASVVTAHAIAAGAISGGKLATGAVSANTKLAAGVVTPHATSNTIAKTNASQTWSAPQRPGSVYANTSVSGSIELAFGTYQDFNLTLTGNTTLSNPTLASSVVGQRGRIQLLQDGSGSRTVALGSNFITAGGTVFVATTNASAEDYLDYDVVSTTKIRVAPSKNWS